MKWWEDDHVAWDAYDLLAMLWTWQHADISNNPLFKVHFHSSLSFLVSYHFYLYHRYYY